MQDSITSKNQFDNTGDKSSNIVNSLVQTASIGIFELDSRYHKFLNVNDALCKITGFSREELLACNPLFLIDDYISRKLFEKFIEDIFNGKINYESTEYVLRKKDGSKIHLSMNIVMLKYELNQISSVIMNVMDITRLKHSEEKLKNNMRIMNALSNSNRALLHTSDEKTYLKQVCENIIKNCNHHLVWIGYVKNDEAKSITPIAQDGHDEGYIETLKLTWADTERGQGPAGIAVRTGKISLCNDSLTDPKFSPWREQAIKHGHLSAIALPISAIII